MSNESSFKNKTCWIPRWQLIKTTLDNLTLDEFLRKSNADSNAVILDVRTFEEYKKGHFQEAVSFDYLSTTLAEDIEELDKSKSYYVYCKTGRRSLRICVLLRNSGFKSIYNLDNGIDKKMISLQEAQIL